MLIQIQYQEKAMQLKLAKLSNLFQVECLKQECKNYQTLQKMIFNYKNDLINLNYLNQIQVVTLDFIQSELVFFKQDDFLSQSQYLNQAILLPNYQKIEWYKLDLNQKIDFATQIIDLVKSLHQINWIHGDLKSAHFLYDFAYQRVVLIDFALALNPTNIGTADAIHATPAYMSPELFHGKAKHKGSDIYALGLILYEIFTEKKPFKAKTYQDWAVAHCQQAVEMLPKSIFADDLQGQYWQGMIDQMLMKRSAYRLQDLKNPKIVNK